MPMEHICRHMDIEKLSTFGCPLEAMLSIIGGKYKIIIVYFLMDQTLRDHELQKCIPQATLKCCPSS